MWVYVVMNFSKSTKIGRERQRVFCREIIKDGFQRLYDNLYVRYCSTMENAQVHKKRIIGTILERSQVSIIFVDDRHNGQSYHYFGRNQKRKNEAKILEMPELVEFFDAKRIVIY